MYVGVGLAVVCFLAAKVALTRLRPGVAVSVVLALLFPLGILLGGVKSRDGNLPLWRFFVGSVVAGTGMAGMINMSRYMRSP